MAVAVPTFAQLRSRWPEALVILALGVLALGLLVPGRSLAKLGDRQRPSLALPEIPSAGPSLMWTAASQAPATTQAQSLNELLAFLSGLAWVGFAVASLSIFSCRAAQAPERAREIGVRRAVGASTRYLLLSSLLESVVLATIALVIGLAFGGVLLALARQWWPGVVVTVERAGPAAALAMSAVLGAAGLASLGLVRSRHRVEPPDEAVGLKVPTFQVAVSVALLMASAALLGGQRSDPRRDPQPSPISAAVLSVDSGIEDLEARSTRYAAVIREVSRLRGIEEVSLTSAGQPLDLGTISDVTTDCGRCVFGGIPLRWPYFRALTHAVSPDSFRARNIRIISGREFQSRDSTHATRVAVVNRHLALRYFQGGQAVGRDIFLGPGWPETPYKVIGVVADDRSWAIGGSLQPRETVYLSVLQHPPARVEILVRSGIGSRASPDETAWVVRRVVGARGTVALVGSAAKYGDTQVRAVRWFGAVFGIAALMVLLLALIGTVATTKMWADSIGPELALRRALGARKRRVIGLVFLRTAAIGAGGAVFGLFLYGTVLVPALSGSIPHLPLGEASLLLGVALPPVLLALVAGAVPGLRLLRRPPSTTLR